MIVSDIILALKESRFPLVISDRKDQIEDLMALMPASSDIEGLRLFRLDGGMTPKERRTTLEQINIARDAGTPLIVFATVVQIIAIVRVNADESDLPACGQRI